MKEFFKRLFTGLLLLATFSGAYLHSSLLFSLLLITVFLVILFNEWPRLVPVTGFGAVLFSALYPCLPMLGLFVLHALYYPTDFYLPLYPFLIAWSADTWGYAVGKLFGHHKVCPSISPGKSWEGLAGSFVGVCIAHVWILPHLQAPFAQLVDSNWLFVLGLSAALTGVAFLGGVFLSVLKRAKNLKDAGDVLPGHGGFLDRFDSVFAVVLVVWVLLLSPVLFSAAQAMRGGNQVTSAVVK